MALPNHVALYHKTVHDSIDGGRLFPETAVPPENLILEDARVSVWQ